MKKDKSCGVILVKDNKVLLEYQTNGFWSFPKGHVEGNESEAETAARETFEETGLIVEVDTSKRFILNYIIEELGLDKDVVLFFGKIIDDSNFKKQDSEIHELRWVPVSEVDQYFTRAPWKKVWEEIKESL